MTEAESPFDVAALVAAACAGEETAWSAIVNHFQPVISGIVRRYRIPPVDAADVSQAVWLKLLSHIGGLRDARALPGWISVTASRACLDVIASRRRTVAVDPAILASPSRRHAGHSGLDAADQVEVDAALERHEREQAVRLGLSELTPSQRELLGLLMSDPPLPYAQISQRLGVPVGSIGPSRARCLKKLGGTVAVRRLTASDHALPLRAVA